MLPEVHKILANKMVHTYGNELLENRQMVGKDVGDSVLEVPLMLPDTLKVIAATSTCKSFTED